MGLLLQLVQMEPLIFGIKILNNESRLLRKLHYLYLVANLVQLVIYLLMQCVMIGVMGVLVYHQHKKVES